MNKVNKVRKAFSNNLQREMGKRHMTVADLAKMMDIPDSTVRSWYHGTKYPRLDNMQKLADIFHITRSDLTTSEIDGILPITQTVKVPLLGNIACGDPILASENVEEYIDEPVDYLPSGKCFYLRAKGNSMKPTIPNGSKVLIRQQATVEDGEIAAVLMLNTNEATLKRIKRADGMVILIPDNPDFQPIIATKDNPIRILGRAMKVVTDL